MTLRARGWVRHTVRGAPTVLRVDTGPEFISDAMADWAGTRTGLPLRQAPSAVRHPVRCMYWMGLPHGRHTMVVYLRFAPCWNEP
ncbi:hypothetical protein R2Q81_04555 [Microbacterium aquimaris]|uniref:hypothetical protein n=1 Tax=Microbacterium aquimaris TaxID=459816 RepID=UPI002AD482FB|nr:hypothetical protein [Microbacterium aquimaris]MDZ8275220.1 hypothetical protein [Microbacterium aquimaris]